MPADILPVDPQKLGRILLSHSDPRDDLIDQWQIGYVDGPDHDRLQRAATELRTTDIPVAFPTETVYGLGADATRSSAVQAIFEAKGRPSDNPLIVHVDGLDMLRNLLRGFSSSTAEFISNGEENDTTDTDADPIPPIYRPLIQRFWPGPLTLIMPLPPNSSLAPEVTAGLRTFGARMPRSILALSLIRLAGVPLAGPSANASTRPSPTAAEHVYDDLFSKIHTIIDGGPCEVGVESTVVDGLGPVPTILRPGGVTVEELRGCEGWENVQIGYKDKAEGAGEKPRAPGMKYRHYSPKAQVLLYEAPASIPSSSDLMVEVVRLNTMSMLRTPPDMDGNRDGEKSGVGIIRTRSAHTQTSNGTTDAPTADSQIQTNGIGEISAQQSNLLQSLVQHQVPHAEHSMVPGVSGAFAVWEIVLGSDLRDVARGLFSALRELDKKGVRMILVEGIDDTVGDDIAAAVMNRLRKAAEVRV